MAEQKLSVGVRLFTDLKDFTSGFKKAQDTSVQFGDVIDKKISVPLNKLESQLRQLRTAQKRSLTTEEYKKFGEDIKRVRGEIDKFTGKTEQARSKIKSLAGNLLAAFSVGAIISFAKSAVAAYDVSIKAETALLTALKGRVSVQKSLIDQASELQGETLFDDDDTVRAQSLVAAFVKEEDAIKKLIPLIQDMATAKQMDLAGAADLVTKTYAGTMNALGRYGIKVTGAAGSAERLTSITKGLNDAFGGQAKAAAQVGTAALVQLGNEYENLTETIGKVLIESQNKRGSFTKLLSKDLSDWSKLFEIWGSETISGWNKIMASLSQVQMDKIWEDSEKRKKENEGAAKAVDLYNQSISETQKKQEDQTEATEYQIGTIGSLTEQVSKLNKELLNTNTSDIESIKTIYKKIIALEKQKDAIDNIQKVLRAEPRDTTKITPITNQKTIKSLPSIAPDTSQLDNMNSSLQTQAEKIKGIREETNQLQTEKILSLSDSFGSLGNSIGGATGEFFTMVSSILSMIPTLIAQISALTVAQVSGSQAITAAKGSEAIASGTAASQSVPFPLNLIALAATIGAIISALATPIKGKHAFGGVIPGTSFAGDKVLTRVNSGEEILTANDPRHVKNGGKNTTGSGITEVTIMNEAKMKGEDIYILMKKVEKRIARRTGK